MTRKFSVLGSCLALALSAAGSAWAAEPSDDKCGPHFPAQNEVKCRDAGGWFFVKDHKKICVVVEKTKHLDCDKGFTKKLTELTIFTREANDCDEFPIVKRECKDPYGKKAVITKCEDCNWTY